MKLSTLLLPLALVGYVSAHDDGDMDMDMDMDMEAEYPSTRTTSTNAAELTPIAHESRHKHGLPILETNLTPAERLYWESYNTTTLFTTDKGNRNAFWYHVITITLATAVTYPVSLVLNNVRSNWYLPMLSVHFLVVISSLISLSVFGSSFPEDWYPHNAYAKMSWILLFVTILHFVSAIITQATKWVIGDDELDEYFGTNFIPLNDYNAQHEQGGSSSPELPRDSVGSPTTTLIDQHKNAEDFKTKYQDDANFGELYDEEFARDIEQRVASSSGLAIKHKSKTSTKRDNYLSKVFSNPMVQKCAHRFGQLFKLIFRMLNYPMLMYLLINLAVGVAVGSLFGKGIRVFNLLAHWIKGGVFLSIGLVSLARYCGFGAHNGWSWNKTIIFKNQVKSDSFWYRITPHGTITMEGLESFLIFFYGSTNVFLEHLSNPGGEWAAKDLQHVSIAFMYIGCGLCGLLAEYKLSDWRYSHVLKHTNISSDAIHAGSPGYSPNPFPAFTIFWTGILMSQHAQASQTSTTIHVQWGYLLSYGSFFRLITFVLLMLVPNKNLNPSRPFTELITSFCLLCGGLIFMESTDQVVEALEYRGLTSMFTFNLSVGFITLVMAWEMLLFMWRDWLKERANRL